MVIKFNEIGESLGTRHLGENVRKQISEKLFNNSEKIIFDFDGVEIISNSFADECFGKLVEEYGLDFVRKRSTFRNVNTIVETIIRKAINDRLKSLVVN